ncbi:UDP-2,4-diacetamido-2,4,6-trideoxy-beta-L-altropyranose hydrolase [Candidatus Peribacteria bacterium]|nr:UDP-2,4-diacetamido-2,4,6-trideoxy-beta-L-altropyranose hydrolase [Candidatus Peribacteria bacterium]
MNNVLFRADGNATIATGHVMRCLTIAEAVHERGGNAFFVCAELTPSLRSKIQDAGCELCELSCAPCSQKDAEKTVEEAKRVNAQWIVTDGYGFDGAYQDIVKSGGSQLMVIDDYGHADHYCADIVFNQNISADEAFYRNRKSETMLLLGPKYALIRREFRRCNWTRVIPDHAAHVLATVGGSDPENISTKIMHALASLAIDKRIIAGGSSPFIDEQKALATTLNQTEVVVDALGMAEHMAWADIAIGAGGSTTLEMAYMGIPFMTMIFAMNQEKGSQALDHAGVSMHLGWAKDIDGQTLRDAVQELAENKEKREAMSAAGRALVDGDGVDRVVMHLLGSRIRLRRVHEEDMQMLFKWANDPVIRSSAFSTNQITWEDHAAWFAKKLHDPKCTILIAFDTEDTPIGQIRFDEVAEHTADIDVHLAPDQRGKGYGPELIREGVQTLHRSGTHTFNAYIKEENAASMQAFTKAGFTDNRLTNVRGNPARHFFRTA